MTDADFRSWLDQEVDKERMTPEQRSDLLDQKQLFDKNLPAGDTANRNKLQGFIVGYVASERLQDQAIHALLDLAKSKYPGRMIYFEPIGFDLF